MSFVIDSGYVLDQLEAERKFLLFAHHQEMLDAIEDAVRATVRSLKPLPHSDALPRS